MVEIGIMTRPVEYEATCEALNPVTRDIIELGIYLDPKKSFSFHPGQFINVYIPQAEGKRLIRAYSLACPSKDHHNHLTLCIDTDSAGPGTTYLTHLKVGDIVRFKGPLGRFKLQPESERSVLFITHVSALATCRYMAEAILKNQPKRCVTLIGEAKHDQELFQQRALLDLAKHHRNFRHVLTRPGGSGKWTGPRRTLLDESLRRLPAPLDVDVYIVGLGPMVSSIKKALKAAGVPSKQIITEKWSKVNEMRQAIDSTSSIN